MNQILFIFVQYIYNESKLLIAAFSPIYYELIQDETNYVKSIVS